jgi:HD-GYP domain-containing protein (c-di-GMP phosphodiesterase class II)
MIKKIHITELTIGMYVESVVKQNGNVRIKSKGLVKSQAILVALENKGILEVEVDFGKSIVPNNQTNDKIVENHLAARSAHPENYNVVPSALENNGIESQIKESKLTNIINVGQHQEALKEADKLYIQAKNVQKNFVSQLRSGSRPNIDHLNDLSQNIINSVFDNADALSCLLMLKDSNEYLVEHAINCAILLTMFANSKGMSQAEVEDLTIAGLLMDIGMASLPADLLEKTSELNDTDWKIMRSHVEMGLDVAERLMAVVTLKQRRLQRLVYMLKWQAL